MLCIILGVIYYHGQCDSRDDAKEAKLCRKAAERGDAEAQFNLGVMYKKGQGVPQDDVEAAKWLRKAATQGCEPTKQVLKKLG